MEVLACNQALYLPRLERRSRIVFTEFHQGAWRVRLPRPFFVCVLVPYLQTALLHKVKQLLAAFSEA
jgi:hypothetical protein